MAVLLENTTNYVWQAFSALQQDKTGLAPKSKLKVHPVCRNHLWFCVSSVFECALSRKSAKQRQVGKVFKSAFPYLEKRSGAGVFWSMSRMRRRGFATDQVVESIINGAVEVCLSRTHGAFKIGGWCSRPVKLYTKPKLLWFFAYILGLGNINSDLQPQIHYATLWWSKNSDLFAPNLIVY